MVEQTGAPEAPRSSAAPPGRRKEGRFRHRRIALYVAGGFCGAGGAGLWLVRVLDGGSGVGGTPVRIPPYAVVGLVTGILGWMGLLILGEAMLFVLAVRNVADREMHDRYRNLMILWGYVLTLGTSRLFRRLPAQFAGLFGEEPVRPALIHREERRPRSGPAAGESRPGAARSGAP